MELYKRCGCGKKGAAQHTKHANDWIFDYYDDGRSGKHVRMNLGPYKAEAEILKGRMIEDARQGGRVT